MKVTDYSESLESLGLNSQQAFVYTTLLQSGPSPARRLASLTGISRTLIYKVLEELEELTLVKRDDPERQISIFTAEHPLQLREIVTTEKRKLAEKSALLEGVLSGLISEYTAISGKPGVRILVGMSGVAELYEDVLNENQNIKLIRSPKDASFPELAEMVAEQIDNQVAQNIHTQTITPFTDETEQELGDWDPKHLVSRRLIFLEKLDIPAQILIYANKIAITAYEKEIITTIIENEAINESFNLIFQLIWQTIEEEDQIIRQGLKDKTLKAPMA